jgi:hypothetical protein
MHFGGETDNGTYSLSADRKTLTMDPGTNDETVADVLTLNASTLKIKMTQNAEEDLDDDGADEQFNMTITMTLNR